MVDNPAPRGVRGLVASIQRAAGVAVERVDAWTNALTGFGLMSRDKTMSGRYSFDGYLSDAELTSLYVGSDMAARIIDCVPEECFREGFEIAGADGVAEEISKAVKEFVPTTAAGVSGVAAIFADAMRWGRLYGGAAIVLGADDGGDAEAPLREDAIRTFKIARVVDRRWIWPVEWYRDPMDPKFGNPSVYQITTLSQSVSVNTVRIHETRLILFGGEPTPNDVKLSLSGWDNSVLKRCYAPLRQFDSNWKSLELLLTDASQGIFKIKDLYMLLAQGNEKALMDRLALVDMGRSIARSIVIDDTEEFKRDNHTFAGIPDALAQSSLRLSASARIPVTVLMCQSPTGMNATGESDFRMWYDRNGACQRNDLQPRIERFIKLLCLSKDGPTGGNLPDDLCIKWKPLWKPTAKEEAETYSATATGDKLYVDMQAVLPEEVALSRFTTEGFSPLMVIDREAREAVLKDKVDVHLEEPPEPEIDPATGLPVTNGPAPEAGAKPASGKPPMPPAKVAPPK